MNDKIHHVKMVIEANYSECNDVMKRCASIFHSSLKHDCGNIIREVIGGYERDINIDSININLGDFSANAFELQFRSSFIQAFREQLTDVCLKQKSVEPKEANLMTFSEAEQMFSRYLHCGCWPYEEKWQQDPASWLAERLTTEGEQWYPFIMSACLQALPRYRLWLLFEQSHVLRHYCAWPKSEANLLLYALRYFQRYPHLQANYLSEPVEKLPLFDCTRAETKQLLTPLVATFIDSPVLARWVSKLLEQKAVRGLADSDARKRPSYGKVGETEDLSAPTLRSSGRIWALARRTDQSSWPDSHRRGAPVYQAEYEAVPVYNAGIVVLWPLLPDLLRRLKLWENGQFISAKAQRQAACWLDWLVWQEEPQAQRMAFSRWLCGLDIEEDPELHHLSPELAEIALSWLAMLPKQLPGWKALREADVRQLFLQRPGHMMVQGENIVLCVEPEPWDLMLQEWPWSFSRLALPWLPGGLEIDWDVPQYNQNG